MLYLLCIDIIDPFHVRHFDNSLQKSTGVIIKINKLKFQGPDIMYGGLLAWLTETPKWSIDFISYTCTFSALIHQNVSETCLYLWDHTYKLICSQNNAVTIMIMGKKTNYSNLMCRACSLFQHQYMIFFMLLHYASEKC